MKKALAIVATAYIALAGAAMAQEVRPEIARDCAERWGNDYRMQVHCRNKQMEAWRQLNVSASPASPDYNTYAVQFEFGKTIDDAIGAAGRVYRKGGITALNKAITKCYYGAKNRDNLAYCITLDMFAAIKLDVKTGRNALKPTVTRAFMAAQPFFGDGTMEAVRGIVEVGMPDIVRRMS